jgi:hypothetical protein
VPTYNGKPFHAPDYYEEWTKIKLTTQPKQLQEAWKRAWKPPGKGVVKNGLVVYPHFR